MIVHPETITKCCIQKDRKKIKILILVTWNNLTLKTTRLIVKHKVQVFVMVTVLQVNVCNIIMVNLDSW